MFFASSSLRDISRSAAGSL